MERRSLRLAAALMFVVGLSSWQAQADPGTALGASSCLVPTSCLVPRAWLVTTASPTNTVSKADVVAVKGGTVVVSGGQVLEGATVLIEGGKIKAVGKDVSVPDGAKIIDAHDRIVTPGLIDARSGLLGVGLGGTGSPRADVLDSLDPFDQDSLEWALEHGVTSVYVSAGRGRPLAGQGVVIKLKPDAALDAMAVKDSAALEGTLGFGEATRALSRIKERAAFFKQFEAAKKYKEQWEDYEEQLSEYLDKLKKKEEADKKKEAKPEDAKKKAADKPSKNKDGHEEPPGARRRPRQGPRRRPPQDGGSTGRDDEASGAGVSTRETNDPAVTDSGDPERRLEAEDVALKLFSTGALAPGQGPAPQGPASEKDKAAKGKEEKLQLPKRPRKNLDTEVLVKVIEGLLPLRIEAHTAAGILSVIDLASKYPNMKIVLCGGRAAGRLASDLAVAEIPVVLEPVLEPDLLENSGKVAVDSHNAARLADAGVTVALAMAGDALQTRFVAVNAALAVARGLPGAMAFDAITRDAAAVLGVGNRLGTLEVGKDADLVVFDEHPLSGTARAEIVLIDGEVVYRRKP